MTTPQTRQHLHTILDLCVGINNQEIAEIAFDYKPHDFAWMIISYQNEVVFNDMIGIEKYEKTIAWLTRLSAGDYNAIPGYTATLEKQKAERLAQYEKLKGEFA